MRADRKIAPADKFRLQRLNKIVDRVTDDDRAWFERHPERKHRIRLAHRSEIAMHEIISGAELHAPHPDLWMHVVIRNVRPGMRLRCFLWNCSGAPVDLDAPEELGVATFENLQTDETRLIEFRLKALETQKERRDA